ncbi:MAG: hypothetical protein ACM3WV_08140 [Bacillota bacterium]
MHQFLNLQPIIFHGKGDDAQIQLSFRSVRICGDVLLTASSLIPG